METAAQKEAQQEKREFEKVFPTYCFFPVKSNGQSIFSEKIVLCYVFEKNKDALVKDIVQIVESGAKLDPENTSTMHSGEYNYAYMHNNQPVYKKRA